MKKNLLSILFITISTFIFSQTSETDVSEIAARVKIFLPATDQAQIEGANRYIQIGILGHQKDVNELVGYMDRYIINDKDMTARVEPTISEEGINYYKFYMDPLFDANNFQSMLEMFKVMKFFIGKEEHPIKGFSNTIYASLKAKK